MTLELIDALRAIDLLNSWVRAPSYQSAYGGFTGPAKHIYYLKGQALRFADDAGLCERHWPIRVETQCNRCGGTGRYDDGYSEGSCRKCEKGTVTLRFWETTITGMGVWHTPSRTFPYQIEDRLRPERTRYSYDGGEPLWRAEASNCWFPSPHWTVHQPGRDLSVAEVCVALLVAEDAFPERDSVHWRDGWWGEGTEDIHDWRLYLGRHTPIYCPLCASVNVTSDTTEQTVMIYQGPVFWQTFACAACLGNKHYIDRTPPISVPFSLRSLTIDQWLAKRTPFYAERKAQQARLCKTYLGRG